VLQSEEEIRLNHVSYLVKKAAVVLTQESKLRARELSRRRKSIWFGIFFSGIALVSGLPGFAGPFVINPTFTGNFNTNFGGNAGAARTAWMSAANVFTTNFSDNITVNITVDAVTGTGTLGQSDSNLVSDNYTDLYNKVVADAKTADDATARGPGGSVKALDPVSGTHTWWVTNAQAKALNIAGAGATDGTTTFGAGNPFTFSGTVASGTYDFQGVAAHEISEVLGRIGLGGGTVAGTFTNSYSLLDLFSYSGASTRVLGNGGGAGKQGSFSIDNGTTLLKQYNNQFSNGLDYRDWAGGTNDSFNQFANSGVTLPVSDVDLREIDVIGYDRVVTPEPSTGILLISGLVAGGYLGRRRKP